MKLKELIGKTSLKAAAREAGLELRMAGGRMELTPTDPDDPRYCTDFFLPTMRMVDACRADDFDFFQPFIDAGRLTAEQMHRAAARYHLGKTRSGKPLFWMIDERQDPLDAHIASDGWLSTMLKTRQPLLRRWCPVHCLFGQHLLSTPNSPTTLRSAPCDASRLKNSPTTLNSTLGALRRLTLQELYTLHSRPVAIVESEASAVVLSELFPDVLWMAYATVEHLDVALFAPLRGRTVTFYPNTDPSFSTYLFFLDLAESIRGRYDLHVSVASILEEHATPAQKERCIDLLEFLREGGS